MFLFNLCVTQAPHPAPGRLATAHHKCASSLGEQIGFILNPTCLFHHPTDTLFTCDSMNQQLKESMIIQTHVKLFDVNHLKHHLSKKDEAQTFPQQIQGSTSTPAMTSSQ